MRKTLAAAFAVTLAMCLSGIGPAFANLPPNGGHVNRIQEARTTSAPVGYLVFCLQHPEHCRGGGASQVQMTPQLMQVLTAVNRQVNSSIRARPDGSRDVWQINVSAGDCEEFALAKRARLIAHGVPASALRIAVGYTRSGAPHAVLVVRTTQGDYVLDNLTGQIREWHQTGHRLVAMATGDPRRWRTVG